MLLIALVVVALAAGWTFGGKLSNIDLADLRLWWLAPAGLIIQFAPLEDPWAFPALMTSYLVLVVFAVANIQKPGIPLILIGLAMNWLVIGLNVGMPVDTSAVDDPAAVARLETEGATKHHVMTDEDELAFLGDTLGVPVFREVYSLGDLALYAGVGWFIAVGMLPPRTRGKHAAERDWGAKADPRE